MLAFSYLYWNSNECNVPAKEETNETLQYAIDQIQIYFHEQEKLVESETELKESTQMTDEGRSAL